ncbi:unnamed protein product [Didymodactylos carnosus]|uniref:Uncharacterized protein n=1 Tax=Didymodactylos carnosus TaxID=1234261 RepID=A0A815PXP8_9BILA|nr:unnamed protein product [Didymodactylos carnosus]CAF4327385.1 unnamed protein product [Didymodactylos carnosus]
MIIMPHESYNESEAFDNIWSALKWREIRRRIPICFSKTIRSWYMLGNFIYLGYTVGALVLDYDVPLNNNTPAANKGYLGLACIHLTSAFLYWYAWQDHTWSDVIMIPEYMNMIEACLYVWSSSYYPKQSVSLFDYYSLATHKIELAAGVVDLIACVGWIMSWYRTYTRTLGRGFAFDDPDTFACLTTTVASCIYVAYNIRMVIHPEEYDTNHLYYKGDILFAVGGFFYIMAAMRDDGWLWFMPFAGQYGIAVGKVKTGKRIKVGLPPYPITDFCRNRKKQLKKREMILSPSPENDNDEEFIIVL